MSLETLFTKKTKVTYRDVEFEINELTLEHVPLVAHLAERFLSEKGDMGARLASILKTDTGSIRELVSSMANINKEHINKLPIDVIVFLGTSILESNLDYIKKNVLPVTQDLAKKVKK